VLNNNPKGPVCSFFAVVGALKTRKATYFKREVSSFFPCTPPVHLKFTAEKSLII
jgi:hypothetical protein